MRAPDLASNLIDKMRLTSFARSDFCAAYGLAEDPVENARCLRI